MRYLLSTVAALLITVASAHAAPLKACTLVTPAQVQAVIGGNVGAGEDGPGGRCIFNNKHSVSFYVDSMAIADLGAIGPAMAKKQMLCSPEPGKTCETIHGVGEAANYTTASGDAFVIFLYHGYLCTVDAQADGKGQTLPNLKDQLIVAAKAMMSKM